MFGKSNFCLLYYFELTHPYSIAIGIGYFYNGYKSIGFIRVEPAGTFPPLPE